MLANGELLELLDHVVGRTAVTRHPGVVATKSGFGSEPPIDLDAFVAREQLAAVQGFKRGWLLEEARAAALELIERPARVPLGACPHCGAQLAIEFDRVAVECRGCYLWTDRADAVHEAREYVNTTWLTPREIEWETRGWGTPVRAGRVRLWRHRGQITVRADGRYLLADVLAVLDRQAVDTPECNALVA